MKQPRTRIKIVAWTILIVTPFLAFEILCRTFNLLPPKFNFGEPQLGWAPKLPGKIIEAACLQNDSGKKINYVRNEIGIRTSYTIDQILHEKADLKIAIMGDSQTDICATNEETHPGILEKIATQRGVKTLGLSYGQGKYSPLQEYILFKTRLKQLNPNALIINFYTGNDFNDMLRIDDRPYFVPNNGGYTIHGPIWYKYDDPNIIYKSRLLYLTKLLGQKTGFQNYLYRIQHLYALAKEQNQGYVKVFSYLNDLRSSVEPSVGYSAAFAAQMLNQELFFFHFRGSRIESVKRVAFLMRMIKEQNPSMLLIMSAIPSYQLVSSQPLDEAFVRTVKRLPFSLEDLKKQEEALYYALEDLSNKFDWMFIDNLKPLREYHGRERLYNNFDYHLTEIANEIIGVNQAEQLVNFYQRRNH